MNGKSGVSERRISSLMLERYRLGEVTEEERKLIEAELSAGGELHSRLEAIENSDRELRRLYPWNSLALSRNFPQTQAAPVFVVDPFRRGDAGRNSVRRFRAAGLCAAAIIVCVLFPSLYYMRLKSGAGPELSAGAAGTDRAKGTEAETGLSLYLEENPAGADNGRRLSDRAVLEEGNTVQLAYSTPPGAVYYGVIFSIDGRSALTLHYPYQKGQSPVLAAGKRTFLNEAYTLDDAPDFETFFMVISPEPLDTERVLETAGVLAADSGTALEKCAVAFSGCRVETITVRKR